MTHSSKSPQTQEKNETAHHRGPAGGQEAPGPADNLDPVKVASFRRRADGATKARVVTHLQQEYGNAYVQHLLVQKVSGSMGAPDWSSLVSAAATGTTTGINQWVLTATLTDVLVNGPHAQGGNLRGVSVAPAIVQQMTTASAPARVAHAFAHAVGSGWSNWTAAVNVPGLRWYPAFAAFPGP